MPIVTVILEGKEQKFDIEEKQTVYDGVFDKGVDLPHGCLAGSCGACRSEVLEGIENFSTMGEVEKDTIATIVKEYQGKQTDSSLNEKNIRLTCRSHISGDVKISPLEK